MAVTRQGTKAATPATQPARTAAPPAGQATRKGGVVGGESEEQTSSGGSFANLFDQTPASSGFGIDVPPGDYECILIYARLEQPNDKGQSVLFKYEVCDEGDSQGKVIPTYYKVLELNGTAGKGMGILKKDLALLGFPDVSGADLEDAFKQLEEAMDGVALKVKINGQYTNAYLQGLVENSEIVAGWKAIRPDKPF